MIRFLRKEDIDELVALEKECFDFPWSKEVFLSTFASPYFFGFCEEREGEIVGYICLTCLFEDGNVDDLAVKKEFRGQGIGKSLLTAGLREVERRGGEKVFLEVRESNLAARNLYEKEGFVFLQKRAKYYENGEDGLVLWRGVHGNSFDGQKNFP